MITVSPAIVAFLIKLLREGAETLIEKARTLAKEIESNTREKWEEIRGAFFHHTQSLLGEFEKEDWIGLGLFILFVFFVCWAIKFDQDKK